MFKTILQSLYYLAAIAFGVCAVIAAMAAPNLEDKFTGVIARRLYRHVSEKSAITTDQHAAIA
jgi:hypothetical protein